MGRYLHEDGSIDFEWIRDMRCGLVPGPRSEEEQEVLVAYFHGGEAGVVRHLARTGEIDGADLTAYTAYRDHLEDRRRQHSANGRGRRTR